MKKMFSVLVPVTLQQLVISMNFIIDNLMVSYLGEEFIAALGSSNKFMVIVRMSIIAICSASGSLISQYRGSRHKEGVSRTFAINSIITFSTAMIFCIIFFTNKDFILSSFSDSKEIVLISWSYLSIIIFTSFSFSLIMPMMTVVRSTGNVVSALLVSVISLFTNFIFNFILIYGKFGIPALGIRGAAISTVISEVLSIIILLAIVNYKITPISKIKDIDFSFKDIDKFLRVSLPLLSAGLLTSLSLMFSHNIFGRLGEEELAAYGIISPMENILSDLFAGVGLASIVIIGAELGRNKFESAYSHAKSIIWSGLASSLIIGSCFIFFSSKVTWFLDIDEERPLPLRKSQSESDIASSLWIRSDITSRSSSSAPSPVYL